MGSARRAGVQLQGVLDQLFFYSGPLGAELGAGGAAVRVWAPTAQQACAAHLAWPASHQHLARPSPARHMRLGLAARPARAYGEIIWRLHAGLLGRRRGGALQRH